MIMFQLLIMQTTHTAHILLQLLEKALAFPNIEGRDILALILLEECVAVICMNVSALVQI
jgi:hypothetical protein